MIDLTMKRLEIVVLKIFLIQRGFFEKRNDDGMLKVRAEFTSSKRKSSQTGLLVRTVMNELQHLDDSGRMKDAEIWGVVGGRGESISQSIKVSICKSAS